VARSYSQYRLHASTKTEVYRLSGSGAQSRCEAFLAGRIVGRFQPRQERGPPRMEGGPCRATERRRSRQPACVSLRAEGVTFWRRKAALHAFASCSTCRDGGRRRFHPKIPSAATRGGWPMPMRGSGSSPCCAINELPQQLDSHLSRFKRPAPRIETATNSYCLRKRAH